MRTALPMLALLWVAADLTGAWMLDQFTKAKQFFNKALRLEAPSPR